MRSTRTERRTCEIKNEQRKDETREGATRERQAGTQRCDIDEMQIGAK